MSARRLRAARPCIRIMALDAPKPTVLAEDGRDSLDDTGGHEVPGPASGQLAARDHPGVAPSSLERVALRHCAGLRLPNAIRRTTPGVGLSRWACTPGCRGDCAEDAATQASASTPRPNRQDEMSFIPAPLSQPPISATGNGAERHRARA